MSDRTLANQVESQNLVSIIVATRNNIGTISRCLSSIFDQSYQRREIIAVDGGSTDGTKELLRSLEGRLAYLVSEPDDGIYQAWNKGVRVARGGWICFLGSDDLFHDRDALGELMRRAASAENRVVYGRMNLVTASGAVAETVGSLWVDARRGFLAGFMIPHPGTLHRRSLFEQHGEFDESYRVAGDYEFLLRELIEHDATFVDRVIVDMRLGGISVRPDSIHSVLQEVARARRAHGLLDSPARLRLAIFSSWIGARIYAYLGTKTFATLADTYRVLRGKPRIWTL